MTYSRAYQNELMDKLIESIGMETLLDSISQYFSDSDMCKALESIATDWDVEYCEDEEEDE